MLYENVLGKIPKLQIKKKYFKLLFQLTSLLLLTVGRNIYIIYGDFEFFLDDGIIPIPRLLIVAGALMFTVAFFGMIGAFRESTLLTNTV